MAVMQVAIEGLSPLLMKSAASMIPTEEPATKPKAKGPSPKQEGPSIAERLEASCYRLPNGDLGFPGTAPQRLIFDAAKGLKFRENPVPGGKEPKQRKTGAQTDLKGLYLVEPLDLIRLLRKGKAIRIYERDVRPVVNKTTKGRIVEYRPKIGLPWRMEFQILLQMQFSPILNLADQIIALLDHGGTSIGIGSFRPQCQGWFGKFKVAEWAIVEE